MYAAMTHRRVFLHAIGILMICTLLLSLPLPDVSQAETPALTHTFYIPLVRATDLSGKIAMNLIDTSSTHTLNKLEVLDAASLTIAELGQGDSPSWSPDGTKIAFLAYREISLEAKLYVINPDGSGETKLSNTPAGAEEPRWSPDGTKILFQIYNQPSTYWAIINADGTAERPLFDNMAGDGPVWSPDGAKIAFSIPNQAIYIMNADGSGTKKLADSTTWDPTPRWSPDGTKITFMSESGGQKTIFVVAADGAGVKQLTDGSKSSYYPVWSPNSDKIVYAEVEGSASSIIMMNADGSGRRVLAGGNVWEPIWSPDGNYVAFTFCDRGSCGLWAVSIHSAVQINLTTPAPGLRLANMQWHT